MENLDQPIEQAAVSKKDPSGETASASPEPGFRCYICGEPSTEICPHCTRDTCDNHVCERCLLCSDCCTCDEGPR